MSSAQVSSRTGVVFDMEAEQEQPELVRCLACRELYEQAAVPARAEETATCPHCGEVAWLAAWIPVEETGATAPA